LREIAKQSGLIALEAAKIEGGFEDAGIAVVSMKDAMDGIAGSLAPGIAAAKELADQLFDAAKSLAETRAAGIARGPAGAVEDIRNTLTPSGMNRSDIVLSRSFPARNRNSPDASTPSGGGGQDRDPAIGIVRPSYALRLSIRNGFQVCGRDTTAMV
jgi:hypothetical protein